jgi:hypothetical protein
MTTTNSCNAVLALPAQLGGSNAIIYGDLFMGREALAKSWFLLVGAAMIDEDEPIAPQIKENVLLFKKINTGDRDQQTTLLVALELFCVKERPAGQVNSKGSTKLNHENIL